MKSTPILAALGAIALVAACNPAPDSPLPAEPPMIPPVPGTGAVVPPAGAMLPGQETESDMTLTGFTPDTNEIFCSFHVAATEGLGERLFVTEIGGTPAPAYIGLGGEAVRLERVSRDEAGPVQTWLYRNAERPLVVELRVTETGQGFESRDYQGTIRIIEPEPGEETRIEGVCGV